MPTTYAQALRTSSADHSALICTFVRHVAVTAPAPAVTAAPSAPGGSKVGAPSSTVAVVVLEARNLSSICSSGWVVPGAAVLPTVAAEAWLGIRLGAGAFCVSVISGPLSPGVDLLDGAVVLEQADLPAPGLGGGEFGEHRPGGDRVGAVELQPAAQRPVGPHVGVVLVRPQARDRLVGQPRTQAHTHDAAGLVALDAALAIGDLEEPAVAPAGVPLVLGDPAAQAVVVADQRDAVAAGVAAGDVLVDAGPVAEEVLVDVEAGRHGPVGRDVLLDGCLVAGQHVPRGDLGHPV